MPAPLPKIRLILSALCHKVAARSRSDGAQSGKFRPRGLPPAASCGDNRRMPKGASADSGGWVPVPARRAACRVDSGLGKLMGHWPGLPPLEHGPISRTRKISGPCPADRAVFGTGGPFYCRLPTAAWQHMRPGESSKAVSVPAAMHASRQ